jgi:hypothetical protein
MEKGFDISDDCISILSMKDTEDMPEQNLREGNPYNLPEDQLKRADALRSHSRKLKVKFYEYLKTIE